MSRSNTIPTTGEQVWLPPRRIRQQENQQLGVPLAVARAFSPRLRRLAGSGLYKRLIGHIDKCSPEDLLDDTGPRRVVGVP